MVVERGEIWWADPGEPEGSEPGFRRPLLIVQSDAFQRTRPSVRGERLRAMLETTAILLNVKFYDPRYVV